MIKNNKILKKKHLKNKMILQFKQFEVHHSLMISWCHHKKKIKIKN